MKLVIEFAFEMFDQLIRHHKSVDERFDSRVMKNTARPIREQSVEQTESVISYLMPNRAAFPALNYNHQVESISVRNHFHNHQESTDSHPMVISPIL